MLKTTWVSCLTTQTSSRLLRPPAAAPTPLRQKEPRCQEVTAAPPSLCPNSGIHPTRCWGTTASLSRDTTSTADGAWTVRRQERWLTPPHAHAFYGWLLVVSVKILKTRRWFCALWWPNRCLFREETVGDRPVPGDEHSVQVLVLLPEGQLQQEDVRGVQTVCAGGCQRKQQVRKDMRYKYSMKTYFCASGAKYLYKKHTQTKLWWSPRDFRCVTPWHPKAPFVAKPLQLWSWKTSSLSAWLTGDNSSS